MVNTQELENRIKDSGKSRTFLAGKCGIKAIQTLKRKIDNEVDFTTTEVEVLCKELGITKLTEKESIFFAK